MNKPEVLDEKTVELMKSDGSSEFLSSARECSVLNLTAWDLDLGAFASLCFESDEARNAIQFRIENAEYAFRLTQESLIAATGLSSEFGVTVFRGAYPHQLGAGTVLIVVNCGQEPPTLQFSARLNPDVARAWSWRITHELQHQIIDFLSGCVHGV